MRRFLMKLTSPGVSHGFTQMTAFLPEARFALNKVTSWLEQILTPPTYDNNNVINSHHRRALSNFSVQSPDDEEGPLEFGSSRRIHSMLNTPTKENGLSRGDHNHRSQSPPAANTTDVWEEQNVIQENKLLERRRQALVRGLGVPNMDNQVGEETLSRMDSLAAEEA